jgi:hypothetical protein
VASDRAIRFNLAGSETRFLLWSRDDAQKAQRPVADVLELVHLVGRDVDHVAKGDLERLLAEEHLSLSPEDHHAVVVGVLVQRSSASGFDPSTLWQSWAPFRRGR